MTATALSSTRIRRPIDLRVVLRSIEHFGLAEAARRWQISERELEAVQRCASTFGARAAVVEQQLDERGVDPHASSSREIGLLGRKLTWAERLGLIELVRAAWKGPRRADYVQRFKRSTKTWARLQSARAQFSDGGLLEDLAELFGFEHVWALLDAAVDLGELEVERVRTRRAAA